MYIIEDQGDLVAECETLDDVRNVIAQRRKLDEEEDIGQYDQSFDDYVRENFRVYVSVDIESVL